MTKLTIEDINDMTELDKILIHTLSDYVNEQNIFMRQETDGTESTERSPDSSEAHLDGWVSVSLNTARSFFGDADASKIRYLANSEAHFIKRNGPGKFLFDRKFLENSADLSHEEVRAMENGGELSFPVAMTVDNIRKRLNKQGYGIPSGWKVKAGQKKPANNVGAKIWTIKNKQSSKSRHLVSVRDLKFGSPTIYKMIKETFK